MARSSIESFRMPSQDSSRVSAPDTASDPPTPLGPAGSLRDPGRRRVGQVLLGAGLLGSVVGVRPVAAQTGVLYPTRPVRFVVPFPPGGATDLVGRLLATRLAEIWGEPVVVENRPGASGMIGTEVVARAPADGYTVLIPITTHIQAPAIYAKLPYDPFKDFVPISQICLSFTALAVPADSPVRTLKDFITRAKSSPGLSYGSFGAGSSSHIVGERFSRMADLGMVHVPYKGSSPMIADLLGGQLASGWVDVSTATPHFKSGRLQPVVVTGEQRAPMLPEVPTLLESGYKGFEPLGWVGVMVAAGTPPEIAARLGADVLKVVQMPEVRSRLEEQTLLPVGSSAEAFGAILRRDSVQWRVMARDAGITPQ